MLAAVVHLTAMDVGGAQVLYGVEPRSPVSSHAVVRGLRCSQEKRDQFRIRFTSVIIQRISPPIATGTVTVHFWPVVDRDSRQPIDDLFIIGTIQIFKILNCINLLLSAFSGVVLSSHNPTTVTSWNSL